MTTAIRDVAGAILLIVATGMPADAAERKPAAMDPVQAVEIYTFVLPAIDCYRTTDLKYTTSQTALEKFLPPASHPAWDRQSSQMLAASKRGTLQYEKMIAKTGGKRVFCATVVRRYGSKGTVARGLVIEKRG